MLEFVYRPAEDCELPAGFDPDDRLIDAAAVAAIIGASKSTVWRMADSGELPPVRRVRSKPRWRLGDVKAYAQEIS